MISRVHSWLTSSCRWTHFSGRHVLQYFDLLPGQPSFAPKVRITSDDCYLVGISCWWCCYFELIIKRSAYVRDSGIVRLLSPLADQFHLKIFSMYKLIFSSFCCSTNPLDPLRPHSALHPEEEMFSTGIRATCSISITGSQLHVSYSSISLLSGSILTLIETFSNWKCRVISVFEGAAGWLLLKVTLRTCTDKTLEKLTSLKF